MMKYIYFQRSDDMVDVGSGRDNAAKYVGQVLYQGGRLPVENVNNSRALNNGNMENEDLWAPNSGKISAVRRTFLLLTVFDVGLSFILWVIYTQLLGNGTGWDSFSRQVVNYTFKESLFDTVMLSFIRFTLLNLAYALFRLRHWWTVALTTLMTSTFLIVKIFLFEFTSYASSKNPLSYCLLIISFVLAWVETWFLDFKVLPQERKDLERRLAYGGVVTNDERAPLLGNNRLGRQTPGGEEYYSPLESAENSGDEDNISNRDRFYSDVSRSTSRPHSTTSLDKTPDYVALGEKGWNILWSMVTSGDDEWTLDAGRDMIDGCIYQKNVEGVGKLFKLQVYLDINPEDLWNDLVHNCVVTPEWNPTVLEIKVICVIDNETDICYSVAAEGGGGLVSSRDFVTIRRYGCKEGIWMSAGFPTTHPDMPPQKKYVRGENLPGGWVFKPTNRPDQCLFIWFVNTNLKGWLPQKLVDQTLSGVLLEYVTYLKRRVKTLKQEQV
ncbi:hypothetical protein SNE40_010766 [Patella caerulea]|uniref:StAR-related lipid transfer protein 3 n=1 Tax=Patella caerulea TaxID=87958 RepID=A0AAN8Q5G1_PATCE